MRKKLLPLLLVLCLLLSGCVVVYEEPWLEYPQWPYEGNISVHFIDVGQADCALVECGGEFMIIDGGNVEDSRKVVSYLQHQGIQKLEAVVCSHAHEDHVGGLPAVLAVYEAAAVYAPTRTYSSHVFDDFLRYTDQQGLEVTIPEPGDQFALGDATVTVLGPVKSYAETNDTSLVLRVDYGSTSFLFTGDMELQAENDMLDYWMDYPGLFQTDVLKVGHHGSDTSTGYRFLYEVNPTYGVISVGEGNSYGHPAERPLSRMIDAGMAIFRTDELGSIQAVSDGTQVSFYWENQWAKPENAVPGEPIVFIGNRVSRKFHGPDCTSLPKQERRVEFTSYNDAVAAGYDPCGSCME